MRKLTLLTFLIFASFLYAEDEPIVLDKDILYWRPAGEDVQIPDFYLLSPVIKYGPDDYISPLFIPLEHKKAPPSEEVPEEEMSREDILYNWTPPSLFIPGAARDHHNTLTLFASHPYGSGLRYDGSFDSFSLFAEGNYSHDSSYPHWGRGGVDFAGTYNTISADLAYRQGDKSMVLPLGSWQFSSDIGESAFIDFTALGHGSFLPGGEGESLVASSLGGGYRFPALTLEGELGALWQSFGDALFLLPEFSLSFTRPASGGDWSLKGGAQADIPVAGEKGRESASFYPLAEVTYRDYGSWSLTLKGGRKSVDRSQIQDFLTSEVYEVSGSRGIERYAYYDAGAVFTVTGDRLQSRFEGGWARGDLPILSSEIPGSSLFSNIYGSASFSWPYRARRVTELSCYADYQDKGSFRFFAEGRWLRKGEKGNDLTLLVRGGNREILKGYGSFFDEDSDLMAGAGVEMDFAIPLSTALYLDYLPRSGSVEGRVELSLLF